VDRKKDKLGGKFPLIAAMRDHHNSHQKGCIGTRRDREGESEGLAATMSANFTRITAEEGRGTASTPAQVRMELEAVFTELDRDQSGELSRQEFKVFLKMTPLGSFVSDGDAIFNDIDIDGTGLIDVGEFLDYFDMIISKVDYRARGAGGQGELSVYNVIAAKIVDSIVGAKDHKNRFRRAFMQSVMDLTSETASKNKLQATQWPYRMFDKINTLPTTPGLSFLEHTRGILGELSEALSEPAERPKEQLRAMRGGERRRDEAQRAKEYKNRCSEVYQLFFGTLSEEDAPKPTVVQAFCARWSDCMAQIWAQARADAKEGREQMAANAMKSKLQRWSRVAKTTFSFDAAEDKPPRGWAVPPPRERCQGARHPAQAH